MNCIYFVFFCQAGVFKLASDDVMKERKVIKPRRKLGEVGSPLYSQPSYIYSGCGQEVCVVWCFLSRADR